MYIFLYLLAKDNLTATLFISDENKYRKSLIPTIYYTHEWYYQWKIKLKLSLCDIKKIKWLLVLSSSV